MLHKCLTETDFDAALAETAIFPAFLNVHYSILFQKTNGFPEVEWQSFWYQNTGGEKIYVVSRVYKDAPIFRARSFIIFCSILTSKFDKSELWRLFDEVVKNMPHLYAFEGPVTIAAGFISEAYREWFHARFSEMSLKDFPCHLYYMSKEQQLAILEDFKDGISLPPGYFFDQADPEKDTQIIFDTWRHSAPGDYETTQAKIKNLPSSLVREKGTGNAVAFELVDSCGFMNHLFTLPEHRNKGIGSAVEYDLCIKLIKNGIVPFKDVETFNTKVLAASEKSKYWSRWDSSSNAPVIMTFHKHISKTTPN